MTNEARCYRLGSVVGELVEQGTVGSFDDMAAWIFTEAGQPRPKKAGPLTPAQAWNTASGVYLLGRKP